MAFGSTFLIWQVQLSLSKEMGSLDALSTRKPPFNAENKTSDRYRSLIILFYLTRLNQIAS
jgi:hypothetical protein